jgi:hypothetical protein
MTNLSPSSADSNFSSTNEAQHVKYLIEIEINCEVSVRTHDLCSNIMLNNHLFKKLKLIRKEERNHFIYILTLRNLHKFRQSC